jgi:hypothetical protein
MRLDAQQNFFFFFGIHWMLRRMKNCSNGTTIRKQTIFLHSAHVGHVISTSLLSGLERIRLRILVTIFQTRKSGKSESRLAATLVHNGSSVILLSCPA